MTTKHTPGPWVVNVNKEDGADWAYRWPTIDSADYQVVGTEGIYGDLDTDLANAQLIAAAPDLLEDLRIAKQFMEIARDWNIDEAEINGEMRSTYDLLEIVDGAISKAIGVTK